MQHLSVLLLASWWSFCAPQQGGERGGGAESGSRPGKFTLESCDSTCGSHRGARVGPDGEALGRLRQSPASGTVAVLEVASFVSSYREYFIFHLVSALR